MTKPKGNPNRRYILTASGRKVFPLDLDPDDITIEDVTHHLSNICRFTGAPKEFYSVAQHSVHVSEVLEQAHEPPDVVLWGLLHDASEAYLLDLAGPLKGAQEFAAYREVEERVMDAVAEAFGLEIPMPDVVHAADMVLLATEKRDIMPDDEELWAGIDDILPMEFKLQCWSPPKARRMFAQRYAAVAGRMARA